MFNVNEPSKCVGFESQWKIKLITKQDSCQTTPVMSENVSTTTSMKSDSEIQTEKEESSVPQYDEQRLAEWLTRLYPKLSQELNDVASSQVFRSYGTSTSSSHTQQQCKLLKTLKLLPENGDFEKSVSSLSWNATGKKLAISVTQDHASWCHHVGYIFIYTFQGASTEEEQLVRVRTTSCVTCVSFHPKLPPILAVGTYTGDILILNTQNNDNEQTLVKIVAHDNVVTQITWVDDLNTFKVDVVASGSLDGSLKLWQFNISQNELQIEQHFKLRPPHFGRLARRGETPREISRKIERGIVAFDFSKQYPEKFVVAAEGGLVAQCSRLGAKLLPGEAVLDPVCKYYRAHEGEITSISLSPDKVDLFATNGSEGEIRVYDVNEEEPGGVIRVADGVVFAGWVPYSQNLLAACGASGWLQFYDAKSGKLVNTDYTTKEKDNLSESCLTCLAFHKIRISVVAIGTKDGSLQIWDIPWNSF